MQLFGDGFSNPATLGVMVCGHGSRNRDAVAEFAALAEGLRRRLPQHPVAHGYLEFAHPVIRAALDDLRAQGVERIVAVPAMLFAAGHVKNDIPAVLNRYSTETGLRIDYGRELGVDAHMLRAATDRIRAALPPRNGDEQGTGYHDTLLVVVGRGSSDPDANANVAKITRLLVEGLGFGWGETCYSGVTFPLVEPCLRQVVRLGYRHLVVFPYFLFSGVLVSRISRAVQRVAADHPEATFCVASYLGDHPLVLTTLQERLQEALSGNNTMNCALCKYRAPLPGFEAEVALPQHSHHHHNEGLGDGCTLCQGECTGACEAEVAAGGHGTTSHSAANHGEAADHKLDGITAHHHHGGGAGHDGSRHSLYPHADHPLGPRTLNAGPS